MLLFGLSLLFSSTSFLDFTRVVPYLTEVEGSFAEAKSDGLEWPPIIQPTGGLRPN
jgi:hypothetical protein